MTEEYYRKRKAQLMEEKADAERAKCKLTAKHKQKLIDDLKKEYENECKNEAND